MPPSISPDDDDPSQLQNTPSNPSKGGSDATTPIKKGSSPDGANPHITPVVVLKARPRSNSKQTGTTLMADFLRGKQSPARLAAEKKRRQSVEAVKAELRQEMKQSSVRRLQQPGGVGDRVRAWQKAHSPVMAEGDPDDAATEPPDVAFKDEDIESVTESDRLRIKLRQKKRTTSKPKTPPAFLHPNTASFEQDRTETDDMPPSSPPKKRVISDEHWRKQRQRGSPPRKVSPAASKASSGSGGITSEFVSQSKNPQVSCKVRDWATKIDSPEASPSKRDRSSPAKWRSTLSDGGRSEPGDSASEITARWVSNKGSSKEQGGRARPTSALLQPKLLRDKETYAARSRSKTVSGSGRPSSPSSRNDVAKELDSTVHTPTKKGKDPHRQTAKAFRSELSKVTDDSSYLGGERSNLSSAYNEGSDIASSLANRSLADIPGDIPFGHSAFSELDLPLHGEPRSRPKRVKSDRSTSISMPKVFKKVVEEGKKIIHDIHEAPRHATPNKPPSIENWLNATVDPFIDAPSTTDIKSTATRTNRESTQNDQTDAVKSRRRSSHGTKTAHLSTPTAVDENNAPAESARPISTNSTPKDEKTPTSGDLKRSRATRSNSSPLKPTSGRRPLLGALKEAFQGESSPHIGRPRSYQSHTEQPVDPDDDLQPPLQARKSMPPPANSASGPSIPRDQDNSPAHTPPKMAGPRFRPPTSGDHELSTIMSEANSSAIESDLTSNGSHSTLTQSTVLTKDSDTSETQTNHAPGLKRRLTKHSDLVSVLSLPDSSSIPNAVRSNRSRPSLRRKRSTSGDVTAQELLREFIDDEAMYLRELKTLVDGVVPVLLSHVVSGTNATELFGPSSTGRISDTVSKSVVSMGVALEKLRSAHRKAPHTDLRKLANWAHGVVPMYNSYISAWRLGFEDVVVNLAPAENGHDDEDSLLDALPRNERGDIVNANGERVAVAHLLKRPLIRVKQMAKLMGCIDPIIDSADTHDLLRDFEDLQAKARRRHKEETARITDEEAANTDTTRCRDLGTLEAAHSVSINARRQVSAKDVFSLSLSHSNSQRLDCQVEIVQRDNQKDPEDNGGDLLIRETGDSRHPYLLFPPISMSTVSARTGQTDFDMVVMVRGSSSGTLWREFFTLTADNEDQILDWLDILPLLPVPPLDIEPLASNQPPQDPVTPTRPRDPNVGFGLDDASINSPRSPIAKDLSSVTPKASDKKPPPARYHSSQSPSSNPDEPVSPVSKAQNLLGMEKTPTKDDNRSRVQDARGRPLKESMRPDPAQIQPNKQSANATSFREDGAPPPPVHRTLSPSPQSRQQSVPSLQPPQESKKKDQLRRRTSSPLKHEYLPSDQSSAISETFSTDASDAESSDDDIDSIDIPETDLGVSIKHRSGTGPEFAEPSMLSGSECSLTPSNSASQAGLHGQKTAADENASRFMASISRWSDKGTWKDIFAQPCSIIVTAGLVEAYSFRSSHDSGNPAKPILALDLTPLVLIRQSTAVDLEIRSSVQPHSKFYQTHNGGNFRFRCHSGPESFNLYMAVHHARLNNQKFIQLENEARFSRFGEKQRAENDGDSKSSKRRSWFGRKNSYRNAVRAPTASQDGASTTPSSTPSASSLFKRLTGSGNLAFNIAQSSVDRQSRSGSARNSLYTSGSSSASGTPPRSPSVSVENSDGQPTSMNTESIRIRLHLLVSAAKWEDYGNCSLQVRRPPPGWRQALRADHGLEKRITVTTLPKKEKEEAKIALDAVLGSGCFSSMGSRGIVCGVWEEVRNGDGVVGMVPDTGATGGNIKKWCFQFANAAEASWVLRLVHQEVVRA